MMCAFSVGAQAKDYVLEDWDGPAPVQSWLTNPNLDVNGWQPAVSDPASFATSLGPTSWSPRGLYATSHLSIFAQPGTAEWRFKAPGTSTVYRAEYAPVLTHMIGCVNLGMRTTNATWQDTVNGYPGGAARRSAHPSACTPGAIVPFTPIGQVYVGPSFGRQIYCSNTTTVCARTGSPVGNSAVFGVQRTRLLQPRFDAYLPGARLYLTDYDKPTFQAGSNTLTGWVRTGTGTVTANATDTGLGVKKVTVTAPALAGTTPQAKTTEATCSGDRNDRCPATWNTSKPKLAASLNYNVDQLPEGVNAFTATATDIVDNTSAADTASIPPTKVDRSAPNSITVTGPLVEDEDHYFDGNDPVAITVAAADPASSDGQQLSGIKTIRIEKVGGPTLATAALNCTGALGRCPSTINQTLNANLVVLPEGAHQLRAVVIDQAGNETAGDTWDIYVDRTPPTAPTGFENDFDEDEGVASASWEAVDPDLRDGRPGSGLNEYRVTYTVNGTRHEVSTTMPSIVLRGAHVGDRVELSVSAVDNVGRVGSALQSTFAVAALPGCSSETPGTDPVPAGLLPGSPTEQADMFVFDNPISPGDFLAGLPREAQLLSVLERSPDSHAQYTSGIFVDSTDTPSAALNDWYETLAEDTTDETAELQAARGNSTDPEYVAEVDRQVAEVTARKQRMSNAGGVPIRAFAVVHSTAVASAIEGQFAGLISRGATVLPGVDCGPAASSGASKRPPGTSGASPTARATASEWKHPIEVNDFGFNSFSPPYIRVRTDLDPAHDRNKITVAWKYTAASNFKYWKSKYRKPGALQGTIDLRGTEVKVLLNQDNGGDGFGYPWWYNHFNDLGPAPSSQRRPTRGVWNASFRCAYPEDYFRDDRPDISVTIGMACRPSRKHHRYRWAHYVTAEDSNDKVMPYVTATHYAQEDHPGANVPGVGLQSERWYCEQIGGGRLGSCMFTDLGKFEDRNGDGKVDEGPVQRLYQLQNGERNVETPSNVVFRRRPIG